MLRRLGHSVHILERHTPEEFRDQGAGLRLGPDVLEFLAEYAPSKMHTTSCSELIVLDESGNITRRRDLDPRVSQVASWAMLYQALRTAFDQSVDGSREGECSYKYRCTVERISEHGDQVDVSYACQGEGHVMNADLVIGADGASSRIRQYFLPNVKRTYSGYVVLRGIVPESELSSSSHAAFVERVCWYWGSDFTALAYMIPGEDDAVNENKRLVNWAWFVNCTEEELADTMTDGNGVKRMYALPMGSMRPEVATRLKSAAVGAMPPQLVELIEKTALPFVQVITDMISPENVFLGGKVVLVGDAMAGAR